MTKLKFKILKFSIKLLNLMKSKYASLKALIFYNSRLYYLTKCDKQSKIIL